MNEKIMIRKAEQSDVSSLKVLYRETFPDEDLVPLVIELLGNQDDSLNLAAVKNGLLLAHIAFTHCHASPENVSLALLGPMAVQPKHQRKGLGKLMIEEGFNLLRKKGVSKVLVLGDPNFYGRSGFTEELHLEPPYSIPEKWKRAWQSIILTDHSEPSSGKLKVAKAWQREQLWSD